MPPPGTVLASARSQPPSLVRILLLLLSLVSASASAQEPVAAAPADTSGRPLRRTITVAAVGGPNALGGRLAFAHRRTSDSPWSFPVGIEVTAVLTGNSDGGFGGRAGVGATVQAAYRLGASTVYLQPGVQLSAGSATTYYNRTGLYAGGRVSLDVIRYPDERGFVVGLGVYSTQLTGAYGSTDAGVAVTLGAQF